MVTSMSVTSMSVTSMLVTVTFNHQRLRVDVSDARRTVCHVSGPVPPPAAPVVALFELADRMQESFASLTEDQRLSVTRSASLHEAVQRTLFLAHGCSMWASDPLPQSQARMLAFDLSRATGFEGLPVPPNLVPAIEAGSGVLATFDLHQWAQREWVHKQTASQDVVPTLFGVFESTEVWTRPTVVLLADPALAEAHAMRRRQAAVLSWWGERKADGYDRTSALFLLRLIADARVFAAIEWLPDGTPAPAQPADPIETEPA